MAEDRGTFLDIEPIDLTYAGLEKGSLKGEVAVIPGSTSNIGLAYARAIAWAGGKAVVSGRREKEGEEIARVINAENAPGTAIFVRCDVSKESEVKNLAEKAFDAFGKVDILINNAMNMQLRGPVLGASADALDESYAISGRGVLLAINAFVPAMLERKHGVVVYSSTQFHFSPPYIGGAIYTAGKAAATSIMMSLANEVKPYEEKGVSVFCYLPNGVGRYRPPAGQDGAPPPAPRPSSTGFAGAVPPEANAAGLLYCILHAAKLHGSGISGVEAFHAMRYPFPFPEAARESKLSRLSDKELTWVFRNMGSGFAE